MTFHLYPSANAPDWVPMTQILLCPSAADLFRLQ